MVFGHGKLICIKFNRQQVRHKAMTATTLYTETKLKHHNDTALPIVVTSIATNVALVKEICLFIERQALEGTSPMS
jgi:hypothetical protein